MKPYDCEKCPAYCCGYPIIETTKKDIRRLARHFGLEYGAARDQFTEKENNRVRKMRQRHDRKLGAPVCVFLDQKTRNCTIYDSRPQICRDHPGDRCEWHDRRMLENTGGKKVIRLKVMPWDIDADYPQYSARKSPALLAEYAGKTAAAKRQFAENVLASLRAREENEMSAHGRKGN
ncbi:MAG: YkgJ family cysteine cluster protein [Betaproteobacteria bacterium]|nr:YkgJ family cysteine cluster protein [Betaproteobacteria bacterium]